MIVASGSQVYVYLRPFSIVSLFVLNVKALVGAFNQEKALVGAFSVITNLRMELFEALLVTLRDTGQMCWVYQSPDTVLYIFPLNFVCPITDNSGSHTWQYMAHTDNGTCRNKTRLNFASNSIHDLLKPCSLELTMTTIGLVLILLARAAYRRVLDVSDKLDLAGDTHAIWKIFWSIFNQWKTA